jgi:hypothetical protein
MPRIVYRIKDGQVDGDWIKGSRRGERLKMLAEQVEIWKEGAAGDNRWNSLPQSVRDGVVASLFRINAPDVCQRGPDELYIDGKIFSTASLELFQSSVAWCG